MITEEQVRFVRKYLNPELFDVDKVIAYLNLHDMVGDEIFTLAKKETKQRIRLVEEGFGFKSLDTERFIRRVPFYFYTPDLLKDEHGGLDDLICGLEGYHKNEEQWERIYTILEDMFYNYKIPLTDIMGYIIKQTGVVNRTDLFFVWYEYLKNAEALGIAEKCPHSIIYAYNEVLEKAGKDPIIYEPGLVGFNENFIRNGNEIIIGGEFPCDEQGKPIMRWIGLWIEDAAYVNAKPTYSMTNSRTLEVELAIGLTSTTKIYMPNIYNSQQDQDIWYPIYFGPSVMEFDNTLIKFYRKEMHFTQEEVAKAIGVQVRTYQKWESGETIPDGFNLIRIMNYLDIKSVQEFVKCEPILDPGFEKFMGRNADEETFKSDSGDYDWI